MTESFGRKPAGYRLPAATRVGRVRLQVSDNERSAEFYQAVLGCAVLHQSERRIELGPAGGPVLIELHEKPGRPASRGGQLGLYHFAVLLPSRPDLARFVVHIAELGLRAGMSDHAVSEAVYLTDPDGLGIEVYADRPRESWKSQDGQLYMTTAHLDVENLLAESEGSRWKGMPSGTRIGHVHLHVADLDQASAFYHDALGFDRVVWSYPGALFLSAGGYHHHLGTNTWARGANPPAADESQLLEWELMVPDAGAVDEIAASLGRGGFAASRDGASLTARDPSGTPLRIVPER